MNGSREVVVGPLFTLGLALGLYGLLRRRRALLALAAVALLADRTPAAQRLSGRLRPSA